MYNTPIADTVLNDCSEVASALATPKSMEIIANLFHKDKDILLLAEKCALGEELSEKDIDVLLSELNGEKGQKLERYLNMHKEEYLRVIGKKEEAAEFNNHAFFTNEGEPTLQKLIEYLQLLKNQAQEKLLSEGVSPAMQIRMMKRNIIMMNDGNGLPTEDMKMVFDKLNVSIDNQRVITMNGKEMIPTRRERITLGQIKKEGKYIEDPDGNISFTNIDGSFYTVKEIFDDILKPVGKLFGLDEIDKAYIESVYKEFINSDLPLDDALGKTLRTISLIFGSPVIFPLYKATDDIIRCVGCFDSYCSVYDKKSDFHGYLLSLVSKVVRSTAT